MIKEEDTPSIDDVREEIKKIDDAIIQLIVERVNLAEKVLKAKKKANLEINDERQSKIVLERVTELANNYNLDEDTIREIFIKLIEMNIQKQYDLLNKIK
ncbi:chorismate mutase [Candidatus Methanoliparum sp. LAM-1]|uniref:chorismate mutase n=1 Tax=Candidatus Methanoliparum sp. LAM-1 TaxID=2874846 RepID=UPI001E2EF82C|nr:chorismate mutase [Candidatus Methanoliparum sp. LAM-1]